jgi:hypothetical protein
MGLNVWASTSLVDSFRGEATLAEVSHIAAVRLSSGDIRLERIRLTTTCKLLYYDN